MTHFQALFVKVLRTRWDYSWRAVHAAWQYRYVPKEDWWFNRAIVEAHERFPDSLGKMSFDYPHGNQINGMDLCGEAMDLLGDSVEDGWN